MNILVNNLTKALLIGISILSLSCNDDNISTANILIVDGEPFQINPNSMRINFKPLNEIGACETHYLKINFDSDEGDLRYHHFMVAGPSLNDGLSRGEYSINTSCNGAINFIEYGKTVSSREKYSCQQWSVFGGWGTGTCYRNQTVSSENYHFQKDTYHDENFQPLNGAGGYMITALDEINKTISLTFDMDVKFYESQKIKHRGKLYRTLL